jgi:GMP synthase (glutamine-hydrolysing)
MDIVVIRHVPFEHAGYIAPVLEDRNCRILYYDIGAKVDYPRAGALILMGGPMSANDPDPWVRDELQLIKRAMKQGIPVLGVCLGAQMVAKALGSRVYRNPVREIGWFPIEWQPAAARDALFHGLNGPETVFHWHGETFGLPSGSVWLAASERCQNQAFRYGDNVYGLQFHLEVTPDMIAEWTRQDANCGDVRELEIPLDTNVNSVRQRELAELVFGRWADLISNS